MSHKLIESWRKCDLESPPFLFPPDRTELHSGRVKLVTYGSFETFLKSPDFGLALDKSLHVGLIPKPYMGDLKKASVFILMLNPGLNPGDYFGEQNVEDFRKAVIRNLRQENRGDEYPFLCLNPQFAWHPGFSWWHEKLSAIARALTKKHKTTYQAGLRMLAKHVAYLELIPYHSKSFGAGSLLKTLPSTRAIVDYAHQEVATRARKGEVVVIVTRGAKTWNLPPRENIVVYEGGETRSAHLTLNSRGGKAIAKHLGLTVE